MKEPAKSQLFLGWLLDSLEKRRGGGETWLHIVAGYLSFFITLVVGQT